MEAHVWPFGHLLDSFDFFWVPSHLDKKVPKRKIHVPDVFFGLNFCADKLADVAADKAQVDNNVAAHMVWYSGLVVKIQKRLVRILISHLEKMWQNKKAKYYQQKSKFTWKLNENNSKSISMEGKVQLIIISFNIRLNHRLRKLNKNNRII